ncbi:MAG: D-aminoacyl-tRNA deacylase [Clostridia bacterium]|nr:D-aminoacyl-tRNA deacylase [Clostridia bacterium]
MRAVVQRVSNASVCVDNVVIGSIDKGLLIFLGVGQDDSCEDALYLAEKILSLRIFEDADEKMNLSIKDISGELLVISQFTLYGDCRKGRRPSFDKAGEPNMANTLYEEFIALCKKSGLAVKSGKFGADMKVSLLNDGPVTLILDSKKLF